MIITHIQTLARVAAASAVLAMLAPPVFADGDRARFDLGAVQGILAVEQLDGWLLYDHAGTNPIANELVNPAGRPSRRWFYLIPDQGQPLVLIHKVDAESFEGLPGRKVTYAGYRELKSGLASMLKGRKLVAMEYSPNAELPSLSRVDAGTIELVRGQGVKVSSSAELVQFAKALWGPEGRKAHYVAAHHLEELRKAALRYIGEQLKDGNTITERDVQSYILRGYKVRGLVGPPPIVAAGVHTANPQYVPTSKNAAEIKQGDLILIDMWAKLKKAKRPIYADTTWIAYVGDSVPARFSNTFDVVVRAREAALKLITDRLRRRRSIKGFEVDRTARSIIEKAGFGDRFLHRTGHSIDTDVNGAAANLDDYETRDTRNLVLGAGFSISPGIYLDGEFGVRSEINVYIGRAGVEITTPKQTAITPLLTE